MVVGLRITGGCGSETNMSAVRILSAFMPDGHCLDTVLLLTCSDHHRLFAKHHITNSFSLIAYTLVAVGPFDFLGLLVLFV